MSSVHHDLQELSQVTRHDDCKRLVRRIKRNTKPLRDLHKHISAKYGDILSEHTTYIEYVVDDISALHTYNTLDEFQSAANTLIADMPSLHNIMQSFIAQSADLTLKGQALRTISVVYFD
jgi:hypothetical protein